jgi:hypothetical protein
MPQPRPRARAATIPAPTARRATRARPVLAGLALSLAACSSGPSAPTQEPAGTIGTACEQAFGPRQLRLLTRREYNASILDLASALGVSTSYGGSAGASCESDAGCDVRAESCVAGACQADPCSLRTFYLPASGAGFASVVVAGSFNGWGATAEAGGWPMSYVPELDAWVAKRAMVDGEHAYKLVADGGTWLQDPGNPSSVPDGFGGFNSLLVVACEGVSAPAAGAVELPGSELPAESRPEHYPFDNHASALVTSVHVEQYLRAGARVASELSAELEALMGCEPAAPGCAESFVRELGRLAFRRPLGEAEVSKYVALFDAQADAATGARVVLRVMLASPYFLYRFEVGAPSSDGSFRLTPHEIASALSYGLWGTMPDAALFAAAEDGRLGSPDGIATEARRLLADARSKPLLRAFALQWLGLETLPEAARQADLFPTWSAALATSMQEEAARFFEGVVLGGEGRWDELFLADYGLVDEGLAAVYGVDAPAEPFSPVTLPPERQAGLLGQAAVLAATSHSNQTSPVRRGLFVRTRLLCQTFGVPPANAGGIPEIDPDATTRERFEQHSSDPTCASCHRYIDPVGFGFERFDAMARYRTEEHGLPIDASGVVTSPEALGTDGLFEFESLPELAQGLVDTKAARSCFVEQSFRFSKGGLASEADACTLEALDAHFEVTGRSIPELFVGLTQVPSFTRRK